MRTIKKNIYWVSVVVLAIVLAIHVYILYVVLGMGWKLAVTDAVVNSAILGLGIWGLYLIINAYPTTAAMYLYSLAAALVVSGLSVYLVCAVLDWWPGTTGNDYLLWLKKYMALRFLYILIFNCWVSTNTALRKILNVSESRFQQHADASALLKEAELFKLRQQLQPHFLYNSLNSINALINIEPERAQDMVGKLSDFLRSSVKRESENLLKIADELEYLQSYLDIESIRFGDRLRIVFENDYDEKAMIPPFLIQPILENAIKFGLYGTTGSVLIEISLKSSGQILTIAIKNPYDKDMRSSTGTGFGLNGIRRRLWLIYGRNDLLEVNKDEQFFTTTLKIPQNV